jgi:hypothetical protein
VYGGRLLRLGVATSGAKHGAVKVVPAKVAHQYRSHAGVSERLSGER